MNSNYTKVYSGSFILINKLKQALEAIGISPIVRDTTESGRLAGFAASIPGHQQLFIHKSEKTLAESVLKEFDSEYDN